jgi:hypothetical protein
MKMLKKNLEKTDSADLEIVPLCLLYVVYHGASIVKEGHVFFLSFEKAQKLSYPRQLTHFFYLCGGCTYFAYTDKKENQISSYIRKFRIKQLRSHIWLTAFSYMVKYLRISSYIRKPVLIYDFATAPLWIFLYMRKICFSFFISVYLLAGSGMRELILTTEKQAWSSLHIFNLWLLHKMKDLLHEKRSGSWANIRNNTLIEKPKPFVKLPRSGDQKQDTKKIFFGYKLYIT